MSYDRPTPPPVISTGKAYEELEGAQGREVFFRPMRYRPVDLGAVRASVEVTLDGATHTCTMLDVSQSGVAFLWPAGAAATEQGADLSLVVRFDRFEAYRGAALVMSVRPDPSGTVVGVSFTESLMDIEHVLHLRDVRNWEAEGADALSLAHKPWNLRGHDDFKAAVGDLHLFLDDAAHHLQQVEAQLPWTVVHGEGGAPARGALVDTLRRTFVADFLAFESRIYGALRGAAPDDWEGLKRFSQQHLDAFLLQAPFHYRSKTKPLGYPGDFEIMRFIYERNFEGSTLFAKAVHLAACDTPGAALVRARKDMLKTRIAGLIARSRPGSHVRIASIAAGPSQEVFELLRELEDIPGMIDIVLYDQDPSALSFAFSRLTRLVDQRWARRVRIRFLHDSIKRLLRDPALFQDHAPFDVVICAGLYDYLDARNATTLTRSLYASVRPGGQLYVGNVVPELPTRWLMEQHLDWFLKYKTRDEMLSFTREAAPDAGAAVVEEATGYNPFICLTRPG